LLPHAPQVALEFLTFALEVAAVLYLATRLRAHAAVPTTRQLELQARWLIPLTFINLLTILIWRAL
ncbi:hypothetical protein, partial [Enhygromyxa salina]|uniref:hypothetical protein n=1 Tax=Enhygromyxa salina TaxID=215803 RepID=UPI001C625F4B